MNDTHIGTYHLGDNPQLYEVQRNNNYEFVVTGLGTPDDPLLKAGYIGTETAAKILNGDEILRVAVQGAPVPHFEQETIEVKRGNNTLKYAGVPTFQSGQVKFQDFIGADVKDVLMAWQNLSYNVNDETVGSLARTNYKRTCYLLEYPPDYYAPVRTWILKGCWIKGLSEDEYSNEDSGKHSITATIEYDMAKIDTTSIV